MIKVDRGQPPAHLDVYSKKSKTNAKGKPITAYEYEYLLARDYFLDTNNYADGKRVKKGGKSAPPFKFVVYKDTGIDKELFAIFALKCAYCEIDIGGSGLRQVEHFRPKNEIDLENGKPWAPGYWWLAGDWDNLLTSCIQCNQILRQAGQDKKMAAQGKGNKFPLAPEAKHIRYSKRRDINAKNLTLEEGLRLLLNPCVDEPELHLRYDKDGGIAAREFNGAISERGRQSIIVYNLFRQELKDKRLKLLLRFRREIRHVERRLDDFHKAEAEGRDSQGHLNELHEARHELISMLNPKREFVGMLRDWIRTNAEAGEYDDIKDKGVDMLQLIDIANSLAKKPAPPSQ